MQVIRTIVWVVIAAFLVAFIAINWEVARVNFWPLSSGDYLHFEWPVGVVALVFFALGLLPTYLLGRLRAWRLHRRISSLEQTVRTVPPSPPPPLATATQLDAEAAEARSLDRPL